MLVKDYHTHLITFSYEIPLVNKTRNFVKQDAVPIVIFKDEIDRIEKDIENSNKFYIKVQHKSWQGGRTGCNALQNPYISYSIKRNNCFDDRDDAVKRNDEYFSYLQNAIDISDEFEDIEDWTDITIRKIEKIDRRKNYSKEVA